MKTINNILNAGQLLGRSEMKKVMAGSGGSHPVSCLVSGYSEGGGMQGTQRWVCPTSWRCEMKWVTYDGTPTSSTC